VAFTYPRNIRWECQRCTLCCGDTHKRKRLILLLETEVKRIKTRTNRRVDEFATSISKFNSYKYQLRKRSSDGKCIFLRGNDCSIYDFRPLICRFYPFWLEKLGSRKYVFKVSAECPGIDHGQVLNRKFFSKLFNKAVEALE
jgi:Fe-S-cluster containining protein